MTVERRALLNMVRCFPSGVTVITTRDPVWGRPVGATVSAFASVSMDPPLVTIALNNKSYTRDIIDRVGAFVVNILREDQKQIALRFADSSLVNKFDGIEITEAGTNSLPAITDALAHLVCTVYTSIRAGDHTLYLGLVHGGRARDGKSLVHCHGEFACARPLEES